ncbi:hypothetical protein [Spirosoma humi]
MKFRKEFIDALSNSRIAHAGQWQVEVQNLLSNYIFLTSLLKKERALSPEMADRCRDLQNQLTHTLTQLVHEVDGWRKIRTRLTKRIRPCFCAISIK